MDFAELSTNRLIQQAFTNSDQAIRIQSLREIANRKSLSGISALFQILQNDKDPIVRVETALTLSLLNDQRAFDTLYSVLLSEIEPVPLRSVCAKSLITLNLERSLTIFLDMLHNPASHPSLLLNSQLDLFQSWLENKKLSPVFIEQIKNELEFMLDLPEYRKSWNLLLNLAKTTIYFGSVMGLKFLLFYKQQLQQQPRLNYEYIEALEGVLAELKAHFSLKNSVTDQILYEKVKSTLQKN